MLLLALSIAPGIAICLYIFLKDQFNREPKLKLIVCFLLGCLSVLPAILLQLFATKPIEQFLGQTILFTAFFSYIVVALSEEASKFLMLRWYAFPKMTIGKGLIFFV